MSRFPIRSFIFSVVACAALAFVTPHVLAQAPKAPDTVVLKGAPMGGVKLNHAVHSKATKCQTCHHPSKPEKAMKGEYQKCQDCHTKAVAAPMKTNAQRAFHDATAKKGTCIDCHVTENAKGKKAPMKCNECHKKENV
jgi:hypothetical protein